MHFLEFQIKIETGRVFGSGCVTDMPWVRIILSCTYMLICDCFKGFRNYNIFRRHSIWNLKTLYVQKYYIKHRSRYEIRSSTPRISYFNGFQVRNFPFYLNISKFTSVHPYCAGKQPIPLRPVTFPIPAVVSQSVVNKSLDRKNWFVY